MNTKEKILTAAIKLFAARGIHVARMEDVGAEAGVNKAMVYYYYSSKENLYFEVLKNVLEEQWRAGLNDGGAARESGPEDYPERIRRVVSVLSAVFLYDRDGAKILLDACGNAPGMMFDAIREVAGRGEDARIPCREELLDALNKGKAGNIFREVDPAHTFLSIIGMLAAYHLAGASIARDFLNLGVEDEAAFLREREEAVLDLVMYGIAGSETRPSADEGRER